MSAAQVMSMSIAKENREKLRKYSGLRVELAKVWESESVVIPVVIGGLGCLSEKFTDYINQIPAEISAELCQKITMLGS